MEAVDGVDDHVAAGGVIKSLTIVIYESLPMIDEALESRHPVHWKPPPIRIRPQASEPTLRRRNTDVHSVVSQNEHPRAANAGIRERLAY